MSLYESSGYIGGVIVAIAAGLVLQAVLAPKPLDAGWGFYEILGFAAAAVVGLLWFVDDARRRKR